MPSFTIKIEQAFTSRSLDVLQSLLGQSYFQFILEQVHSSLNAGTNRQPDFALIRGSGWTEIVASSAEETLLCRVSLPPLFYPYTDVQKAIELNGKTYKRGEVNSINWNKVNTVTISGKLNKIEIYHFREEVTSYDIQTLAGHEFEHLYPDSPQAFEYLLTQFDYFVYAVFYFENKELLIIERPESSDIINFHYDQAVAILKHIKEYKSDDSQKRQYHLVHTIV